MKRPQVERFCQAKGLRGTPIVGAVGPFTPEKGFDTLLQAVPGLLKLFPKLQLLLVGEGPMKEPLIRISYRLNIQEHVVIAHPMKDSRIPLEAMDLLIEPLPKDPKAWEESIVQSLKAQQRSL